MKLFFKIVLLFCLLSTSSVFSQTIVSKSLLQKDQGLSAREAIKVVRDSFGFFYVTTDVDIMRYDGKEVKSLNIDKLLENKVESPAIKSLTAAPNGKIIIRTEARKALMFIDPGSVKVSSIHFDFAMEFVVSGNHFFGIQKSGNKYNIYRINWADKILCKKIFEINSLPINICALNKDYVVETEEGIYIVSGNKTIKTNETGCIINFQDGILTANRKKISFFKNNSFSTIHTFEKESGVCKIIKSDRSGNIVLGYSNMPRYVENYFIIEADRKVYSYSNLTKDIAIAQDIYTDDVHHMWMLTGHHGILSLGLLRDGARFENQRPYLKDATFGSVVSGIAADLKGNVVYAVESGKMFYYNNTTLQSRELFPEMNGGRGMMFNGKIYYDQSNDFFYSFSYSEQDHCFLYKIDPKKNIITEHKLSVAINDFKILPNDEVLICGQSYITRGGILARYNLNKKSLNILYNDRKKVTTIYYEPSNETYWMGSIEGLIVMDKNFTPITKFDAYQNDPKKYLKYSQINMIQKYNNELMVGTLGGGVYGIDPASMSITNHLMESGGLTDNKVVGAVKDNFGNCWLPTFNGITIIDSAWHIVKNIYEQDGLPNKELNTMAFTRDEKGNLYFGSVNGMVIMDPSKVLKWKRSHGFYITEVLTRYDNKTEVLKDLNFKSNFLQTSINYIKPDYIHNLFDNYPPSIANSNGLKINADGKSIKIENGNAGNYVLGLSFLGTDKKINIPVIIRRDYTRILIFSAAIVFALLVYQIYRLRKKNIIQKENAIKNRIAILELEALQSQMNPHFMFNALGSIQYFIQTENIEKADDYLSDFALLMRMILESSHHKFMDISDEIKLLKLYVNLEQIRFGSRFDYEFNIDKNLDPQFQIPPMITQPFIENAINHGINNLQDRKGKLEVNVEMLVGNRLLFSIADNGVGRQHTANRVKTHKSRGTQIVLERVETLNSTRYFNVSIETIDMMEDGRPSGTRVEIIFHDRSTTPDSTLTVKEIRNAI